MYIDGTLHFWVLYGMLRIYLIGRQLRATSFKQIVMHNAAGQCSRQRSLAHLLAAQTHPTPKQAKEPIFPARYLTKNNRLTL